MNLAALLLAAAFAESPYALAASENFSVYAPSQQTADAVLRQAESLREELALEWLGEPLAEGAGRTLIHVRVSPAADRGRSAVMDHRSRSRSNVLWIETDAIGGEEFGSTLRHELTHCVLGTQFPGTFPVWAHEGCAGQYDTGARRTLHEQTVRGFARTGSWPDLPKLFAQEQFSADDRTSYGAAVSLAEYLIHLRRREALVSFAVTGGRDGDWDGAVRDVYGFRDVTELQTNWRRWVSNAVSRSHSPPVWRTASVSPKNRPSRSISP